MIFKLNFMRGHSLLIPKGSLRKTNFLQKQMRTPSVLNVAKQAILLKIVFQKQPQKPSFKFSGNNPFSGPNKFQPRMLQSSQRFEKAPQTDFEAKYRKAKAKLALL
jgi:hypothetical protein